MRDAHGRIVTEAEARMLLGRSKVGQERRLSKGGKPDGYAAPPGTGPQGETCKSCRHAFANQQAKTYWKCSLMRRVWTGGRKTDILVRSPACMRWEARPEGEHP